MEGVSDCSISKLNFVPLRADTLSCPIERLRRHSRRRRICRFGGKHRGHGRRGGCFVGELEEGRLGH